MKASEWQRESEADRGEEGHSVRHSNKYEGLRHTFRIICASFSVSVGRILIETWVCFFTLACACSQVSYCVYMFVCRSPQVSMMCVCVCVRARNSLPLTYVPSFVSEDYSFPFEVRQLARRGRSERRPRAGFHTSPTAACRLGGKYVCRPKRHREKQGECVRSGERKRKKRRVINTGREGRDDDTVKEKNVGVHKGEGENDGV